jgi:hypothetical protein
MRFLVACAFAILGGVSAALAEDRIEVDVELFLAVDVSRSMQPFELEIQRRGYAAALTSPEVLDAIQSGLIGEIALTYVEWAGLGAKRVIVPWTRVATAEDARAVAEKITAHFDPGMRRTSISDALAHAARDIRTNAYHGLRRVIDVSGDGPNNQGQPVTSVRDQVLAQGITINGLPLMTRDGWSDRWGIDDLDTYYRNCVIGGPGAFVIAVHDWDQFAEAVRQKLVLEIAGRAPPRIYRAQMQHAPAYDCLIGEKIWQRNRQIFMEP